MIAQLEAPLAWTRDKIDLKLFLRGLAVVGGVYLLIFILIFAKSTSTISKIESRMTSQTVLITNTKAEYPSAPTNYSDTINNTALPTQHLQKNALQAAPIEGLYENTEMGLLLPIANEDDGNTSFKAYQRPFTTTNKPIIAIIVEDFGLSKIGARTAIQELPVDVTFLLSSYVTDIDSWQDKARINGHETWINLPVGTENFPNTIDPGPKALLASASLKTSDADLKWTMSRTSGYTGLASRTDHVFTSSPISLKQTMNDLFNRGLGFIELNPDASDTIGLLASIANAPYLKADIHINKSTGTESPFKKLESIARTKGYAVGVLSPTISSISQANIWIKSLEAKGFTLAPASAIAELQIAPPISSPPVTSSHE